MECAGTPIANYASIRTFHSLLIVKGVVEKLYGENEDPMT